jgi:hypothetical protein
VFYDLESRAQFNPIVLFNEWELLGRVLSPETTFEEPEVIDAQWWPVVEALSFAKTLCRSLHAIIVQFTSSPGDLRPQGIGRKLVTQGHICNAGHQHSMCTG